MGAGVGLLVIARLGPAGAVAPAAEAFPGPEILLAQADEPIPPPIYCGNPYLQPETDGQSQWCGFDCAEGTVPDEATQECVCADGLVEIGMDRNRRVCGTPAPAAPD